MVLVVAVAGGLAMALAEGAVRTLTAPDRYEDAVGSRVDVIVEQDHGRPDLARMAALPAVGRVRAATFVFGGLVPAGAEVPVDSLVFAGEPEALGDRIVTGHAPGADHPGDFCASAKFADRFGSRLGTRFRLVTISEATAERSGFDAPAPDGPSAEARLVCTMSGPSELQDGYAAVIFPRSLLGLGNMGTSATQHSVELRGGSGTSVLRSQLEALPDGPYGVTRAEVVPGVVRDAVQARGTGIAVVAAVIGIAVLVVLGQLVGRQYRLTGGPELVLRGLGMTRRQLLLDPVARAAVPVLLGTVGAVGLAVVASRWFPLGFVDAVEPSPGLRADPLVLLAGAVVLVLGVLAWATAAIAVAGRPRALRRSPGPMDALAHRLRPLPAALGVRFLGGGTSAGSAVASFAALALVLAAVVGSLTFGASLSRLVGSPSWYGNTDVMTGQGGDQVPESVVRALESSHQVRSVATANNLVASVGDATIEITGLEPVRGDLQPLVLRGRVPAGPDEIALGAIAARDLGTEVGRSVTVRTDAGEHDLRVSGIVVVPGVDGGDGVGQGGVVTWPAMLRLDPEAQATSALADLVGGGDAATIHRLAREAGVQGGSPDPPAVVVNLDRVRSLPYLVAGSLGALAALALAHQLLVAARHRRRDLAVLGALGAAPRWRASIVRWQATLLALATVVVAVPVGIGSGRAVYRSFVDRTGALDRVTVPAGWLLVVAVATLVVANLAAAVPARRVRRQRIAGELVRE